MQRIIGFATGGEQRIMRHKCRERGTDRSAEGINDKLFLLGNTGVDRYPPFDAVVSDNI